jgi:glycosyltransferase involved in cell wall biosynthesis
MPSSARSSPDLSVVMPVYNERATIAEIVERVCAVPGLLEIIAVDDGSHDGSRDILSRLESEVEPLRVLLHERNGGKGAALRTGIAAARGDVVVIQDADLEYDPADIPGLVEPIRDGRAEVVFGSRFAGGGAHRVLYFWHSVGNKLITLMSNAMSNLNLTDIEVCYKAFRREVLQSIPIEENGFGFEPEITAKVAARGCRVYEVGISYAGRTYEEGKKITWRDGVWALWCILKYNVLRRGA